MPGTHQMLLACIEAEKAGDFGRYYNAVASLTLNSQLAINASESTVHIKECHDSSRKTRMWTLPQQGDAAVLTIEILNADTDWNKNRLTKTALRPILEQATYREVVNARGQKTKLAGNRTVTQAAKNIRPGLELILNDQLRPDLHDDARRLFDLLKVKPQKNPRKQKL